jgi:thioredoxin 1
MAYVATYSSEAPERAWVDGLSGTTVLEFGADWCGHCQGAQSAIKSVLENQNDLTHLKIEDGPGRPLGRSFRVKLWPTLIFMRNGQELARVVRPAGEAELRAALELLKTA